MVIMKKTVVEYSRPKCDTEKLTAGDSCDSECFLLSLAVRLILNFIVASANEAVRRYCDCLSVWLLPGYLKKLLTDLNQIL